MDGRSNSLLALDKSFEHDRSKTFIMKHRYYLALISLCEVLKEKSTREICFLNANIATGNPILREPVDFIYSELASATISPLYTYN